MKQGYVGLLWFVSSGCCAALAVTPRLSSVRDADYVGNVLGRVVDSRSGQGVPGAMVLLLDNPWELAARTLAPHLGLRGLSGSSVRRGATDREGRFLINSVPTPYPYRKYTVVALAPGYRVRVFDQVPVLPGAVMALECRFPLQRGSGLALVFKRDDPSAPYVYSHEKRLNIPTPVRRREPARDAARDTGGGKLFATREGLVGRTTANGHVIRRDDRFVALPSRRALSSRNGREFQVRLSYRGRSVVAPVWDVGPWNIRDDHWSPTPRREQWRDLPQGMPQAQAAYERGYNGGRDGFGRRVTNPAGIDLADGTFWRDLRMWDNDWVGVEYLWADDLFAGPGPDRRSGGDSDRRAESRPHPRPDEPGRGSPRAPRRTTRQSPIPKLGDILTVARVILERTR
jgi:hypothetical protein